MRDARRRRSPGQGRSPGSRLLTCTGEIRTICLESRNIQFSPIGRCGKVWEMNKEPSGSLEISQLAQIDSLITKAQSRGLGISDVFKTHITEEQAAATPDIHHPLFDLSDHDRELIVQIRELASQLDHTASIGELVELRGQIVQGLNQG